MALFDRYFAVDWSASNTPASGETSIWIAEVVRTGDAFQPLPSVNPRTRSEAMRIIVARLIQARAAGQRVMAGFDFVFGYPQGAAEALAGKADWRALWRLLAERVEDGDDNRSNRFDLASALNETFAGGGHHYWGHPQGRSYATLLPTRPVGGYTRIPERRIVEAHVRRAQPVWKLTGAGSVGSQGMLGIARLEKLRTDPRFEGEIAIWPFETGFAEDFSRPITVVEIYPSLFPVAAGEGPIDRRQVETAAGMFARLDDAGHLGEFLSAPQSLSEAARQAILREEGWIAGIGHEALVRGVKPIATARSGPYLRDPQQIYAESFRTIAAEADLSGLPEALRPIATRMIHACGMVDLVHDIKGDPRLVAAVENALARGAPVFCDCEMVRAGLMTRLLRGSELVVTLNEAGVPDLAKTLATTRSAAAVDLWRPRLGGSVVVIGNAPTALFRLLELIAEGADKPAAIIATPVGFVGARESKALLGAGSHGVPFITVLGRRGGSAIASAAFNALAGAGAA